MKRRLTALATCFLFSMPTSPGYVGSPECVVSKTVQRRGVTLTLSMPGEWVADSPVWCDVCLRNNGEAAATYGHTSDYKAFTITVFEANGQAVPLTRFGKIVIGGEPGEYKKFITRALLPGQTLSRRYNLSRLFDLTVCGRYWITARREINENQLGYHAVLELTDFPFTVREP